MLRGFAVSALAVLLAGCASTSDYYAYDDGYYVDDRTPVYVGGSSYYTPARDRYGDYYYGSTSYGYGWSSSAYLDYPYYYSLFHPWQRWTVDPYWHPGFYYGVTYYPRSYFSIGFGGGYGHAWRSGYYRSHHGYFAYSPYRLSWVDHYYDWSPWYHRSPSYVHGWYAPRYGNARHETDWLSRQARHDGYSGRGDSRRWWDGEGLPNTRAQRWEDRSRGAVSERREALRGADYGGRSVPRQDPQVSGFGYRREAEIKRPGELRTPIGTQRGVRDADVRGEAVRERSAREGRYIGDSGDVRQYPPRGEAGVQRGARQGSDRVVEATPRARGAREGYRIDGMRSAPVDRERPVSRYEVAPVREAPAFRAAEPRREPRHDYDPRQRAVGERPSVRGYGGYAPERGDARETRYVAPRAAERRYDTPRAVERRHDAPRPDYASPRSYAPAVRESGQPRQAYAPRESYAPREAPAYRAPAYSPPARPSYGESRPERSESRPVDAGERRGSQGRGRAATRHEDDR